RMTCADSSTSKSYYTSILNKMNQIINEYPQLAKGYKSIVSVSEDMFSDKKEEYKGTKKIPHVQGKFKFDNVQFKYEDTDQHVITDFNLEVKSGESIAFVGESGAGKSTLLNLLIGFYRPSNGNIYVI